MVHQSVNVKLSRGAFEIIYFFLLWTVFLFLLVLKAAQITSDVVVLERSQICLFLKQFQTYDKVWVVLQFLNSNNSSISITGINLEEVLLGAFPQQMWQEFF